MDKEKTALIIHAKGNQPDLRLVFNPADETITGLFEINDKKIQNIVKTTTFDNFKNLEKKGLFKESNLNQSGERKTFFNQGPYSNWKKFLNEGIIRKIEEKFLDEMKELNYL